MSRLSPALWMVLPLLGAMVSTADAQVRMPAYLGVSAGHATVSIDCSGSSSCDRADTGWKLFGGYLFHPNFGVELDYRDSGHARLSGLVGGTVLNGRFSTESVGLYALATAREGPVSGFAKLGLATSHVRGSDSVAALAAPDRETNTRPAIGLGMAWDFTERVSARLEFERVRVRFGGTNRDVDWFSAGVLTRF